MREILFRGKRVDNSLWIEGCLRQYPSGSAKICDKEIQHTFKVAPETVGQYTGLIDKRGRKIFEGDILKGESYPYEDPDRTCNYYAEVVWFDDSPAFGLYTFKCPHSKVRGISGGLSDYIEDFVPCMWEVIGNIHDNPDLMGGEGNAHHAS